MNALFFFEDRLTALYARLREFWQNIVKLLRASPLFGGSILLASIVVGLGPVLWWQFFHRFIDASYSARGVGAFTSDLRHATIWIGILMILITASCSYLSQTRALSRSIAFTIVTWGIGLTHALVLLPITKSFLIFLGIVALAFQFAHKRTIRIGVAALLPLLAVGAIYDTLFMMTRRSITVGGMLECTGAMITLSILVGVFNTKKIKNFLCGS